MGAEMFVGGKVLQGAGTALVGLLGLLGCASGGGSTVVTETATVTASASPGIGDTSAVAPQTSDPQPESSVSSSDTPSQASQGEQISYDEIAERVYLVFRGADEIGTAPTLPQTREAWDRFKDASMKLIDLLIMDFSEAGGNEMRVLIAEVGETSVAFANYHSQVIDDRAYCEASGNKAAQQACMRRISDPNDWSRSFRELFDAGSKVMDAIPD